MPVRSTRARDDRRGQVVGADIAKHAVLGMSPANRRAAAVNDDRGFHG